MDEPQINKTMAVTKTYSVTFLTIAQASDMAQEEQISQGDVVRQSVDLRYQVKNSKKLQELLQLTALPMNDLVLRGIDHLHQHLTAAIKSDE